MAYVTVVPGGPADVRHGYTLSDLDRISRSAASHAGWLAGDYRDVVQTAYAAMVDHLYTSSHPPPEHDLWHAGRNAIWAEVKAERRFHGAPAKDRDAGRGEMVSFRRFWWDFATHVPSPESAIVEREALIRIWVVLTECEQKAVLAFATCGTVERAAQALNITPAAMNSRLQKARRRFLAWWHEGETPSKKWRMDSGPRRQAQPLKPCGTPSAYARHRRHKEAVDEACRRAWTAYQKERAAVRAVRATTSLLSPEVGTTCIHR